MITFCKAVSFNVPVTIDRIMKTPLFPKAKVLGHRNNVAKINVFMPTGAIIGYTRSPIKVALGGIQDFDARFLHFPTDPMFRELHSEFHK